jgi:hypothetical protein
MRKSWARWLIAVGFVPVLGALLVPQRMSGAQFAALVVGGLLVSWAFAVTPLNRLSSLQRNVTFDTGLAVVLTGLALFHVCSWSVAGGIALISVAATAGDIHDGISKARAGRISRREAVSKDW